MVSDCEALTKKSCTRLCVIITLSCVKQWPGCYYERLGAVPLGRSKGVTLGNLGCRWRQFSAPENNNGAAFVVTHVPYKSADTCVSVLLNINLFTHNEVDDNKNQIALPYTNGVYK